MASAQKQMTLVWKAGFGQSAYPPPQLWLNTLDTHISRCEYTNVQGILSVREGVGRFYKNQFNVSMKSDDIYIMNGSKLTLFAISAVLQCVHYIIPKPY